MWTHPANESARTRAVVRAIGFQVRGRLGRRTLVTVGDSARMWAELHWRGASQVVYANPPDWAEMQAWRRLLKPGDLFVDVGSNVGVYALWAAECGAEVIAIEPDVEAAERLRENVALNHFPIEILQCALSAEPGRLRFSVGMDTLNHILTDEEAEGREVEVRTLDDIVGDRHAAGVKIDVEGAEQLVLSGAARALAMKQIDVFQIEWNAQSNIQFGETRESLANLLQECGYILTRPGPDGKLHRTDPAGYGEDVFAVSALELVES